MADALNIPRIFGLVRDMRGEDPKRIGDGGTTALEVACAHLACALTGLEAMGVKSTGDSARKLLGILERQIARASQTLRQRDASAATESIDLGEVKA